MTNNESTTKSAIGEMARFILVGVINTLVGSSIMFIAFNLLHINYWISSALNYIIGSICSFFLNKFFTFKSSKYKKQEIIYFVINILVCYFIAYGIARPLSRAVFLSQSKTMQDNMALLAGMVAFTGLNYFGQKFFVFKKETRN